MNKKKNSDSTSIKKSKICNLDDDKDEFHFIVRCPKYDYLRNLDVKKYWIILIWQLLKFFIEFFT